MARPGSPDYQYQVLKPLRPASRWVILPVHYSYDPQKDARWAAQERRGYVGMDGIMSDAAWNREMEIDLGQTSGALAYPAYVRDKIVVEGLLDEYRPDVPLFIACDFNYHAMGWVVGQLFPNWTNIYDEIFLTPGTVSDAVREFRNRFPHHPAELYIYGDATGRAKNKQSLRSDYAVIELELRGYSTRPTMKVPLANPPIKARLAALNRMLSGAEGVPSIRVASTCRELLRDFSETIMAPGGKEELQIRDTNDPRSRRTHLASALGYFAAREFPVAQEESRRNVKKPDNKPLQIISNF